MISCIENSLFLYRKFPQSPQMGEPRGNEYVFTQEIRWCFHFSQSLIAQSHILTCILIAKCRDTGGRSRTWPLNKHVAYIKCPHNYM